MVSIAEAPGKIIISGEHFVVHGSNALAAAIDKKVKVYSETSDKNSVLSRIDNQVFHTTMKPTNPVSVVRDKTLEYLNKKDKIKITIESDIPRGSGLGSSSAVSVATAASIASLFGETLDNKTLYEIALKGEKVIHGTPSGIDVAASVYGGLILFNKNTVPKNIDLLNKLKIIVSISGKKRQTSRMINRFTNMSDTLPYNFQSLINSSSILTQEAVDCLIAQDLHKLGAIVNFYNSILSHFGLSTKTTDRMIETCLEHGAYGAKITGAGGGGSIIAFAPSTKIKIIINELNSLGFRTFSVELPKQGVSFGK